MAETGRKKKSIYDGYWDEDGKYVLPAKQGSKEAGSIYDGFWDEDGKYVLPDKEQKGCAGHSLAEPLTFLGRGYLDAENSALQLKSTDANAVNLAGKDNAGDRVAAKTSVSAVAGSYGQNNTGGKNDSSDSGIMKDYRGVLPDGKSKTAGDNGSDRQKVDADTLSGEITYTTWRLFGSSQDVSEQEKENFHRNIAKLSEYRKTATVGDKLWAEAEAAVKSNWKGVEGAAVGLLLGQGPGALLGYKAGSMASRLKRSFQNEFADMVVQLATENERAGGDSNSLDMGKVYGEAVNKALWVSVIKELGREVGAQKLKELAAKVKQSLGL